MASGYASLVRLGTTRAPEILQTCEQLLEQVAGDKKAEAIILSVMAIAEAMQEQFSRGRDLYQRARSVLKELERGVAARSTSIEGGRVAILAHEWAEAEQLLAEDSADLEVLGERYYRSTIVGLLAHVLVAQGRVGEAMTQIAIAAEIADPEDAESMTLWHSAKARVLSMEGRQTEAVTFAEQALEFARTTDDIDLLADATGHLGYVLAAGGDRAGADAAFRDAINLAEAKGNRAAAGWLTLAREGLDVASS